ncbi:MAG: flavodoxin family protein [Candidatus Omnitrophota bacterium]|nr:flavodoxin family protein [Candidatus Omnitrophota bacterium]
MKALIIYCSVHHRNTEKIARIMGQALAAKVVTPKQVKVYELHQYECIGFGSGIYCGKHHTRLLARVNKFPALNKKVFVFSTSGRGTIGSYHDALKGALVTAQCEVIGEFSCKGFDTFGPLKFFKGINKDHPTVKDLDDARVFAQSLGARVEVAKRNGDSIG